MSLEKRLKKAGYVKASRKGMPPVPLPKTRGQKLWERMKRGVKRSRELKRAHEEKQLMQAKRQLKRQKTFLALERSRTKIAKAKAQRKKYEGVGTGMLGGQMAGGGGGGNILANIARQDQVRMPMQPKRAKQKRQPKKRQPTTLENLGRMM